MDRVFSVVLDTVGRHGMIRRGDTVVVAVSGGLDSTCLLDLLWRMRQPWNVAFVVAHVHHGLRGEDADRDASLVEERASGYGLAFEKARLSPESRPAGGNLQAWARGARYAFLEAVAARRNAQRIATGHHRDDHVETLMMQLFRGTGGFRGILPVRDERYIRPLIHVGREDLVHYAATRGIPHREDRSNRSTFYLRNRIRQELVPWVRGRVNPSFDRALIRFSAILKDESDLLDRLARRVLERSARCRSRDPGVVTIGRKTLERLDPALRRRVIRMVYAGIQGSTSGLSWERVDEVCRFLASSGAVSHRRFPLHGGVELFVEYREVLVSRRDLWSCAPYRYPLVVGRFLPVPEAGAGIDTRLVPHARDETGGRRDRNLAFLAWPSGPGDLVIRNAGPGDRFRPEGMGGEKKLKDYFIDRKIPRSRRVRLPILEIGGRIAWVAGERADERFRPEAGSRYSLQVRLVGREEQAG